MPNERDFVPALKAHDYDIAGNVLRAYSDANGKVVFVLDLMVNENKPNVLLVINSKNGRKWDDVLENDYGVDLETVRPKKDNKYQKLDIEYSGLQIYQNLIDAYVAGDDVVNAVAALNAFRNAAVQSAAAERLQAAETAADNARETIEKTIGSVDEMNARLRGLREKLAEMRKNIGKEPTKQSAAKILRTESQIDAINEKIRRAKKRLENAQKRLLAAVDDADAARGVLARVAENEGTSVPALVDEKPIVVLDDTDGALVPINDKNDLIITTNETKAEEMADEEVKPLFDTDPEILDEEIAFKPIDFSVPVVEPGRSGGTAAAPAQPDEGAYDTAAAVAPLSFTPPVTTEQYNETDALLPSQIGNNAPVLDSITAAQTPAGMDVHETETEFIPQPVMPSYAQPAVEPVAEPDVAPAPIDSGFRPVSPISGVAPVVATKANVKSKQNTVYYLLLMLLIAVSVFVLWFYQKTTVDNGIPNISSKVVPEMQEAEQPRLSDVDTLSVVEADIQPETAVIPEPVVVSSETIVEQPEPTVVVEEQAEVMSEPVAPETPEEPVLVTPAEVVMPVKTVAITTVPDAPMPEPVIIETEEEVLAKKPAYGVSQNEAMFVADQNFETDRLATDDVVAAVDMYDTPIVKASAPQYVDADVPGCEHGAPDRFGCCPGETFTQIDNGGFVCCPDNGGDCFPPLF